jgi:hypothetical protein
VRDLFHRPSFAVSRVVRKIEDPRRVELARVVCQRERQNLGDKVFPDMFSLKFESISSRIEGGDVWPVSEIERVEASCTMPMSLVVSESVGPSKQRRDIVTRYDSTKRRREALRARLVSSCGVKSGRENSRGAW